MKSGYIQIYTGDGKGKTTAALGVALRSLMAGFSVYVGQFAKTDPCRGIAGLRTVADTLEKVRFDAAQFGRRRKVGTPFEAADRDAARDGFAQALAALGDGDYDVVILDELNLALSAGLLERNDFEILMATRPKSTELIVTGRGAPDFVTAAADLVTNMTLVRHYYREGVPARIGIEY